MGMTRTAKDVDKDLRSMEALADVYLNELAEWEMSAAWYLHRIERGDDLTLEDVKVALKAWMANEWVGDWIGPGDGE